MTNLKRKRCIEVDIIEEAMKTSKIKETTNDMDDLINEFETACVLSPEEEYLLLLESVNYEYNEKTINKYILESEKRYKRYIKCVNFYQEGYPIINDYIDKFLINKHKNTQKINMEIIQKIDEALLDIIDEVRSVKKCKY